MVKRDYAGVANDDGCCSWLRLLKILADYRYSKKIMLELVNEDHYYLMQLKKIIEFGMFEANVQEYLLQ